MICCRKLTVVLPAVAALFMGQFAGAQSTDGFAKNEKIRVAWQQWSHFIKSGFTYDQLMENLSRIDVNVWVDMGVVNRDRADLAHKHGMKYFGCGFLNMTHKDQRLAVDKYGLTCPQQWEALQKRPDDERPFGGAGYGSPSHVACPLNPKPWYDVYFDPVRKPVKEGWCDGMFVDIEPYAAYRFFKYGDMLCYCDYCFGQYAKDHPKAGVDADMPYDQRYRWLRNQGLLDGYLHSLGVRLEALLRKGAEEIWAMNPDFRFSLYPDYTFNPRRDWMMMAVARGLHSKRAPFILVASTNYWEDADRPWWEQPHEWYRKQGIQYVMGSWDGGMLGGNPESEVSGDQLMYEMAMASDGHWRWGMRTWSNYEWNTYALANQRLRRVEATVGDILLQDNRVHHFVTVVEQSGDPDLWRRIVTRTYEHNGNHLTRIFNGNSDLSVRVRLRYPRLSAGRVWQVRDPIHQTGYARAEGTPTWDANALNEGLVVVVPRRGELFLLLESAHGNPAMSKQQLIRSFEVPTRVAVPAPTEPLPEVPEPLSDDQFVYLSKDATELNVTDAAKGALLAQKRTRWAQLVESEELTNEEVAVLVSQQTEASESKTIFPVQPGDDELAQGSDSLRPPFVRQPTLSPDRKLVAAAVWVNGRSQIYLINVDGSAARNVSNNVYSDHSPRFSPDGQSIVFASDRDADWEIYTMNVDGANPRRLTKTAGTDRSPVYSPDGEQIAFISERAGDFDVHLMDADGSDQHALFPRGGHEYEPTWSPDGTLVACTARIRHLRCIQISRRDGMDSYYLACGSATGMHSISFSPDGKSWPRPTGNTGSRA